MKILIMYNCLKQTQLSKNKNEICYVLNNEVMSKNINKN